MNNSDDQKVNFDTEMVLEALEHHEQDLCIIKALLLEQTELLRDLRTDYKECLQLLKKPVKPSKKKGKRKVVTLPTRANIRKPYTAKMELAKENVIYKALSRATGSVVDLTKWKGRKVGDIETYEKKKSLTPPQPNNFYSFVKQLTENPHNCCFYIRGERAYTCGTDDNRWFQVTSRSTLFEQLRHYLWDNYVTYLGLCVEELDKEKVAGENFRSTLMDHLNDMSICEIPLTKAFLVSVATDSFNWGKNQPNVVKLESAYRDRKK